MERNDAGWKLYTFGMNYENGRLIAIKIPARNYEEAVANLRRLVKKRSVYPLKMFWLNAEEDY